MSVKEQRMEEYLKCIAAADDFNYRGKQLPHYMFSGIARYVVYGAVPGDFLVAIITNDLRKACENADDTNIELLPQYISFFYSNAPAGSWGSKERMKFWIEHKTKELEDEQANCNLSR